MRELQPGDADACDAIVAGLPDWFGDQLGMTECAEAVRSQEGYVATDDSGRVLGFLTWVASDRDTAEITWMAVRADERRRGHGRSMIEALAEHLRRKGIRFLLVKTLSSRDPNESYEQTREFYSSQGFEPVAQLDIWGPQNPAQLMMRLL